MYIMAYTDKSKIAPVTGLASVYATLSNLGENEDICYAIILFRMEEM